MQSENRPTENKGTGEQGSKATKNERTGEEGEVKRWLSSFQVDRRMQQGSLKLKLSVKPEMVRARGGGPSVQGKLSWLFPSTLLSLLSSSLSSMSLSFSFMLFPLSVLILPSSLSFQISSSIPLLVF